MQDTQTTIDQRRAEALIARYIRELAGTSTQGQVRAA